MIMKSAMVHRIGEKNGTLDDRSYWNSDPCLKRPTYLESSIITTELRTTTDSQTATVTPLERPLVNSTASEISGADTLASVAVADLSELSVLDL